MTRVYPSLSLGNQILQHNNDYGFSVGDAVGEKYENIPSLTLAIPYYEAKNTIDLVIRYLSKATSEVRSSYPDWRYEIIVIDDGSLLYPAKLAISKEYLNLVKIISHKTNKGRYAARNTAITNAENKILIFVDADVLVDKVILEAHLKLQAKAKKLSKNAITVSLFNFIDFKAISANDPKNLFITSNDFRVKCTYQENWIGCKEDGQYIGEEFEILKQTNNFRSWPASGFLGPWILPNMVLGGLFGVRTDLAREVGGCDKLFSDYGFEETSLATKLIAIKKAYVIPVLENYAVHISDLTSTLPQKEKDLLFQKSHALYFDKYLYLSNEEATKEKL